MAPSTVNSHQPSFRPSMLQWVGGGEQAHVVHVRAATRYHVTTQSTAAGDDVMALRQSGMQLVQECT